ncbi:hypothetical protein AAE478_009499 [Parahypoxylon ruwenzoriense]
MPYPRDSNALRGIGAWVQSADTRNDAEQDTRASPSMLDVGKSEKVVGVGIKTSSMVKAWEAAFDLDFWHRPGEIISADGRSRHCPFDSENEASNINTTGISSSSTNFKA